MISSTYYPARREYGVCRGTLWRKDRTTEYCVLVANCLSSYESITTYQRGDSPTLLAYIVGASAWKQKTKKDDCSFRLVTSQGTHIYCQAVSVQCRDLWLSTIHAGLELVLNSSTEHVMLSTVKQPPSPQKTTVVQRINKQLRYCKSCGVCESVKTMDACSTPLPQYGLETRQEVCTDCYTAQQLLASLEFLRLLLTTDWQEREAIQQARNLCCWQCGQDEEEKSSFEPTDETTIVEGEIADTENAVAATTSNDADEPNESQQATNKTKSTTADADEHSSNSTGGSWSHVQDGATTCNEDSGSSSSSSSPSNSPKSPVAASKDTNPLASSWQNVDAEEANNIGRTQQPWIHIPATLASSKALLDMIHDSLSPFGKLERVSPTLQSLAQALREGHFGIPDFMDRLIAVAAAASTNEDVENGDGQTAAQIELKKQAFRAAGDMGTAIQLLAEHALSKNKASGDAFYSRNSQLPLLLEDADSGLITMTCLLDFLLDLCQEGELASVSFYWPQLCHIHLLMLPPENALEAAKVELLEDFLLSVSHRYSIHLALELVWSHTAEVETALQDPCCLPTCRRRAACILRFICELESLLFDYEDGWGGGSVSLRNMLTASAHQLERMKQCIKTLQPLRQTLPRKLHYSSRRELWCKSKLELPPDKAAQEKLRIANNAEYFSGHLNFMKRLCDIAEKLRFLDPDQRSVALEEELNLLNSSGAMGGDPLNRLADALIRVVRVPNREGHVFRSKERTPVLLLMECMTEGDFEEDVEIDSKPQDEEKAAVKSDKVVDDSKVEDALPQEDEKEVQLTDIGVEDVSKAANVELDPPSDASFTPSVGSELEGAMDGVMHSPRPFALKRFASETSDQDETPVTPRKDVEDLMSSVMNQKRHGLEEKIMLPDLSTPRLDHESSERKSEPDEEAEDGQVIISGEDEVPNENKPAAVKRISTLSARDGELSSSKFAPTGDIRREVLNAIMMRGFQGNSIAVNTADAVQRSLKELERKRATELLLTDTDTSDNTRSIQTEFRGSFVDLASTNEKLASLGLDTLSPKNESEEQSRLPPSEEDEVMEAIRLLLIQHRVAQGLLSPEDAAKVLRYASLSPMNSSDAAISDRKSFDSRYASEFPVIDAGDVDLRLVGCGPLPPAVLQALTLWKGGMVTNGELLELVKKDIEFVRHAVLLDAENVQKLNEDSAFWGRFAFGERWAEKKSRLSASSPQGSRPGWDLIGVIVKSNDDLRQEAFVMQLIELCREAFDLAGLELWLSPYRILATGRSTGVIEMVRNAMSFDALKKRPGYGKGGLREHLQRMTEFTADPGGSFKAAQQNFVRSLAAYSLLSYFFLFKDRHNGNILLDTAGHVIHIDFGFVFGIAPGGSFSLEMSTPFKITDEMLEVMGGMRSPLFSEFVTLFCCGFLALQAHCDTFLTVVEIMCKDSPYNCFEGREPHEVVAKLRERFCPSFTKEQTVAFALDLIKLATNSYGTRQYDLYQYLSQGIAA